MQLIDSHCHLKSFLDKENLDEILSRGRENGINKLITVGTNSQDWECYKNLVDANVEGKKEVRSPFRQYSGHNSPCNPRLQGLDPTKLCSFS